MAPSKFLGAALAALTAITMLGAPAQAVPGDEKATDSVHTAPLSDRLAPDRGTRVTASPDSATTLARLQARIAKHVAKHGTKNTFGSYVDGTTGKVVLDTDASADLVKNLTAGATVSVQVRRNKTTDAWHRRDDIPAFYGGGGITNGAGICSSGYAVRNSGGTYMMTAGHCFANGTNVRTESNARYYGTVFARRLPTVTGHAFDAELMYNQPYAGRVFTGGITSTSSIRVVSAGAAAVGYANYCHSGRTTGEQCGHRATSTTAQVCTATGCKSPVIAYTGGVIQQGGDSGGAFYAKDASGAWIRGHVIAGSSTTGYIQPWTVVANNYGVSIVTG